MELGRPTQPSADPSLCAGALRSREQGQISQHHLTGQTPAQSLLPLWAAFWLTHTCCPSSTHTCTSHRHRCLMHLLRAAHSPAWRTESPARPSPRPEHLPTVCILPASLRPLHPRARLQTARDRGTHRCFLTLTSSPKHCCHCQACCQLFPDLVSDSHAVQAPAAPRGGVRGSPASQVVCPCDRSLPWGRANCPSTGLLRAEAVPPPQTDVPPCSEPALGSARS